MKIRISVCFFLAFLFSTSSLIWAQSALFSPEQFFGFALGTRFTNHDQMTRYVEHLAAQAPSQMKVQQYGQSYEGRPLHLVAISAPENLVRIEQIRQNNLRDVGMLEGKASGQQPAIVWLSYNVHGNGAVSSEAVLQVMYDLLQGQNPASKKWL